jgi:LPS-assembly lipoprotein
MWSAEMRMHSFSPGPLARLLCAAAVVLLGACGFHPRGDTPLPAEMAVTYIHGTQEFDALYDDFRTALESRGARVTQDRAQAGAVLDILENDFHRDVLTVDLSGKVLEFRFRQNIQFDVMAADGRTLLERQSVTMSRDLKFNRNDVAGKERESELFRRELQRDVVNLAMLRIANYSVHR